MLRATSARPVSNSEAGSGTRPGLGLVIDPPALPMMMLFLMTLDVANTDKAPMFWNRMRCGPELRLAFVRPENAAEPSPVNANSTGQSAATTKVAMEPLKPDSHCHPSQQLGSYQARRGSLEGTRTACTALVAMTSRIVAMRIRMGEVQVSMIQFHRRGQGMTMPRSWPLLEGARARSLFASRQPVTLKRLSATRKKIASWQDRRYEGCCL